MNDILLQILLVVSIVVGLLLTVNLVRLYQVLTDLSQASNSIKKTVSSITNIITAWRQSAKTVAEFVGEITSFLDLFKRSKKVNEKIDEEK